MKLNYFADSREKTVQLQPRWTQHMYDILHVSGSERSRNLGISFSKNNIWNCNSDPQYSNVLHMHTCPIGPTMYRNISGNPLQRTSDV
jgi:hypothetical protein